MVIYALYLTNSCIKVQKTTDEQLFMQLNASENFLSFI